MMAKYHYEAIEQADPMLADRREEMRLVDAMLSLPPDEALVIELDDGDDAKEMRWRIHRLGHNYTLGGWTVLIQDRKIVAYPVKDLASWLRGLKQGSRNRLRDRAALILQEMPDER